MKSLISLLVTVILGCSAAFANGPEMKITESSHDFGNIKEANGSVSYEFEFVNSGD